RLTVIGSAHAPAFRRGVSASSDSETCYTVNYERQGCEAGVQVPLLPDPRAGRAAESDVRTRPLRLQPGARGATPRVDPGAAQGRPRGDRPDADRMEARPRHGMAGRAVEGAAASIPPQSAIGVRQVLAQAESLPDLQEEGQESRLGDLLPELLHLPRREVEACEAGRTAGHPMVSTTAGWCGPVPGHRLAGRGGTLVRLPTGRGDDHPVCIDGCGRGRRSGDH